MNQIYVVETIDATAGNEEKLKGELLKIVALSRKERGCLTYDLFVDKSAPHRFLVTMLFQDQSAYDEHIQSKHIQEFVEQFDNILYQNVVEHLYEPIHL